MTFPSLKKNNKTVRVLKTPKAESSSRKVFIPRTVAGYLAELKSEQDEIKEAPENEYQDYNLVIKFMLLQSIIKYKFEVRR